MTERTIATTVHGRYLVMPAEAAGPAPSLVGFHGYAEDAEIQLGRLAAIPGSEGWLKVSIQGLHRFYRSRTSQVVSSWMTSQNRELAIADNIAWVGSCVEAVAAEWETLPVIVFAGFSQGVAMAFRAAVNQGDRAAGVIAVGGDVPPELGAEALRGLSGVLLTRGKTDLLYSPEKFAEDEKRLRGSGVKVQTLEYSGGHEWSAEVGEAAAAFLRDRCL
jgi:predicted esterase